MEEIHDEMLRTMPQMRRAIALRYKWYYHVSPVLNADSIRKTGITTNQDKRAPPEVLKHVGPKGSRVICLNPLGADCVPPAVQQGPFICLAISTETLPHRIGVDWTYDGAVGIARVLRHEQPRRPADEIFVEAVKRWGSMVSYDPIPLNGLRVCAKGCLPHDPLRWPMLVGTTNDELANF
jgi:hypothetical protein